MMWLIRVSNVLLLLCASVVSAFALDREAFTFTNYDLNVRLEPQQQRIGVRGKITLRNDSSSPQKIAVLQISSSLDWRSITVGGKAPRFALQPYASDIDHTGALSEAIVSLPQEVLPHATVDLDIGYEGVIPPDATRLIRIGTPEDAANSADWDQLSTAFTAVRGVGNVAWYPVATEAANLSDGDSLDESVGRWKRREAGSKMKVVFEIADPASDGVPPVILCSGRAAPETTREAAPKSALSTCTYNDISQSAPTFAIANYGTVNRPSVTVFNLPTHAVGAETYADAAEKVVPLITNWFGVLRQKAQTADLPDPDAAPFESGSLLLTPLADLSAQSSGLAAAYQLTHADFLSFRPWIYEGLAHFAQALYVEQEKGRPRALEYMAAHRATLIQLESASGSPTADQARPSLVNTTDQALYRSKAMYVWWMLRDMVGDAALRKALAAYRPEQDKEPSYMQRLIAAETDRDLEWFFDDWVYRDRGLPDFKIESVYPRQTLAGSYIVTVTVDNLGSAGAEVPVILKFAGADRDVTKRIEIRAKSKATIRVEAPSRPLEVTVNDGSVPESDVGNNSFSLETPQK